LIENDPLTIAQPTAAYRSLCVTYDLFLDEIRADLGLHRLKYNSAQFTFSMKCKGCGAALQTGFARCPKCRTLRQEFIGWEHCVTDTEGRCVWSHAATDVKAPDGNYYWAPYFIDLVRDGKFK